MTAVLKSLLNTAKHSPMINNSPVS
jgi:hypothetical protein